MTMELRSSFMLLPPSGDSRLEDAEAREGVLVFWAVLEAYREVRVAGAVGVPLLPLRASLRISAMSSDWEPECGWDEPEGG